MKVGGRLLGMEGWGDLVDKVKRKIKKWDVTTISLGGRITIIKSILSALPVYGFSVLPLSSTIRNLIRSLQRYFLWGGYERQKKLAWLKWDSLCQPLKEEGLGFKELCSFNRALLSKWVWRFLREDSSLWKKIIISRHGAPPWESKGQGQMRCDSRASGWWKKVLGMVDGEGDKWFWDNLIRTSGDGSDTYFWDETCS